MISPQLFADLTSYIEDIHSREPSLLVKDTPSSTEIHLGSLAALLEELGELATEVRRMEQMMLNAKKVSEASVDKVLEEGVDVLICTLLLLRKYHEGSLDEAVIRKIRKNQDRGY